MLLLNGWNYYNNKKNTNYFYFIIDAIFSNKLREKYVNI